MQRKLLSYLLILLNWGYYIRHSCSVKVNLKIEHTKRVLRQNNHTLTTYKLVSQICYSLDRHHCYNRNQNCVVNVFTANKTEILEETR